MKRPRFPSPRIGLWAAAVLSIACESSPSPSSPVTSPGPILDTQAPVTGSTPEGPAPATESKGPKVVFLGDSLSAGLHLPADQAFPAVLERTLAAEGSPFQLINAGVSGDTTAGGLRRLDWLLKQDPDVVVIELGANDGLRGQPPAQIAANLRTLIERVKAHGAKVLLLGLRVPPSHGEEYADAFAAIYPKVAEEMSVPVVPRFLEGVGGDPELNLPDGIHPTPEGHRRVAANVAPALKAVLGD